MLKFKKDIGKDDFKKSNSTEIAYLIGKVKFFNEVVEDTLMKTNAKNGDEIAIFHYMVEFLAKKFYESDINNIEQYLYNYIEDDLADFEETMFEEI